MSSSLPLRVHKVYIRVSFSDTFLRWLPPFVTTNSCHYQQIKNFPFYTLLGSGCVLISYSMLIWIRHSLQAIIASTYIDMYIYKQQFWVLFFIILDYFSLFFNSTYPVNSIAKEIFGAEIYRGRLFFRADRSLGAKREGLTIVHFLNKLFVSCKEAVRFPFYFICCYF